MRVDLKCLKCGRLLPADGDCYGCQADLLQEQLNEIASLAEQMAGEERPDLLAAKIYMIATGKMVTGRKEK